jgi:ribosome-associated heat shock protein Hsp15|tara:strand:- start:1900 stop:2259 length:360 start_codon:yes stop_codon:yes gene_type:complete
MRADSFFWSIRLHKTRSLATVAIKSGRVSISDIVIKPSRVLKIGETFKIRHKGYHTTHEVINFPKSRVKMALVENFMKTTTPNEEIEKKKLLDLALKANNNARLGRPTKRDRRDLDGWY